jgi:hypothetical protein
MMTWQEWYMDWSKKPATMTALTALKAIGGDDRHLLITQQRIAIACFNAAHYDSALDPGEIYRTRIAAEKKRLKTLQNAARVLAESARRNDKALMWAHLSAESKSDVRITRKEYDAPMLQHFVMEDYFSSLEAALKDKLPELDGDYYGKWLHWRTKGNLFFNKPIKGGRKITVTTMLAFELAIYLRMQTAGKAYSPVRSIMPDYGEPCYPIIAEFCNAALSSLKGDISDKSLAENVRALKGAILHEWPTG